MIREFIRSIKEENSIASNDIKKGWEVVTNSGCTAIVQNNKKGNIREIKTTNDNGCYAEFGTVYAWDIVKARENSNSSWLTIKLTPKQEKARKSAKSFGF